MQIGGPTEKFPIYKDTLSIKTDCIPDGRRSGIFEPGNGEVELPLANAVHQLDTGNRGRGAPTCAAVESFTLRVCLFFSSAGERINGSFFLVEAESRAEVESFNRPDPFVDLGLWSEVHIRRFYKRVG